MRAHIVASFALLAAAVSGVQAQTILIRNATVLTVTKGTITNGSVLVENGKISAVGKNLSAPARCDRGGCNRTIFDAWPYRLPLAYGD